MGDVGSEEQNSFQPPITDENQAVIRRSLNDLRISENVLRDQNLFFEGIDSEDPEEIHDALKAYQRILSRTENYIGGPTPEQAVANPLGTDGEILAMILKMTAKKPANAGRELITWALENGIFSRVPKTVGVDGLLEMAKLFNKG